MGWALVVGIGFDMTGRQPNREAHLENPFLNLVLIRSFRPAADFFPLLSLFSLRVSSNQVQDCVTVPC